MPLSFLVVNERRTPKAAVAVEITEPSTWLESAAKQANEGLIACLRQIDALFHAARRHGSLKLDEFANLVDEVLNSLAEMLSLTPIDDENVLNALPVLWMSRLAHVIHECLNLAANLTEEFNNKAYVDSQEAASKWSPSILNIYLLVACVMGSKTTLGEPSALHPALKLLSRLIRSGRLDPPDHSTASPSSSSDLLKFWWLSSRDAGAYELLRRLEPLEAAQADVDRTYFKLYTFPYISKSKIPLLRAHCNLFYRNYSTKSSGVSTHPTMSPCAF